MTMFKVEQDQKETGVLALMYSRDKKPTCICQVLHPQWGKNYEYCLPLHLTL